MVNFDARFFYNLFIWFVDALNNIAVVLFSPITDYLTVEIGDTLFDEIFEFAVNKLLSYVTSSIPPGTTVIGFIFGSGFVLFLVITLVKWVVDIVG